MLNVIKQCQQSKEPDSRKNIDKVKICIYLDALINFLSYIQQSRNLKLLSFSTITEKVETHIRTHFSRPNSGVM